MCLFIETHPVGTHDILHSKLTSKLTLLELRVLLTLMVAHGMFSEG